MNIMLLDFLVKRHYINSKTGRPYVKVVEENLKDKLSPEIIGRLKNAQIDITLSHNKSQAIAYVVVSI